MSGELRIVETKRLRDESGEGEFWYVKFEIESSSETWGRLTYEVRINAQSLREEDIVFVARHHLATAIKTANFISRDWRVSDDFMAQLKERADTER